LIKKERKKVCGLFSLQIQCTTKSFKVCEGKKNYKTKFKNGHHLRREEDCVSYQWTSIGRTVENN